ncbi:hypothetical protein K5I29_04115 [Flavobacterium agricola]|uniref:Helix-turn-helix domain-containing protein n=1 Tax=Flavobacterium agricola TaxID=2870839 RepID=A0ABY6M316_9FLAO|nr:hypothetical protein [Flavobacterium agricola]UYW02094.1 hypothetical protein K5I29_04115 [Flavobacterium agricola]
MNCKTSRLSKKQHQALYDKVIDSFLTLEENTVPALAKKHKLPESRIHKILDQYFRAKQKSNQ